jgi:uncharacterized protein (DUF1015 family)
MPIVRPFAALRPKPELAARIAQPPYDVLSSQEARDMAKDDPLSFFHVSKPEIDLPAGTDVYSKTVYEKGAENFRRLIQEGNLKQDKQKHFYLYRQIMGGHAQLGLVGVVRCEDYRSGVIKKHEFTQPEKEDDRVRHMEALNAQTGPVFLTYRAEPQIDQLFSGVVKTKPWADFTAADGVQHTAWVVEDEKTAKEIEALFAKVPAFYIADGHHRSAAAVRVSEKRKKQGGDPSEFFLAVIFPHNQMQVLPYHRVVKDLKGLSPAQFLEKLRQVGILESGGQSKPEKQHEICIYLDKQWHRFHWGKKLVAPQDALGKLDVSLLQHLVLARVLGIEDPRRDSRIKFVGGIRGTGELEKLVNSGAFAVAFSMYPTSLLDLMTVADAGEVMPPKSTWFEPKLRDGLFCHML